MKKNIMLPIAATFIAVASLPTAFAKSEVLFSYANMSDDYGYVAIKGGVGSSDYAAINDVGWVAPHTSGVVGNDFPWIMEQQIDKNSLVSVAFLTRNNEVISCKENFYLDRPVTVTLTKNSDDQLECTAEEQTNPSFTGKGFSFRFKYLSQYTNYGLFIYDPVDEKWKNVTKINSSYSSSDKDRWVIANSLRPEFYSTSFTNDSIVKIAVREDYNSQDEEYNQHLPLSVCGDVKFSGNYEFVFYENGEHGKLSGCSTNIY
ncbi:MAG: hypothetical protein ACRC7P_09885 [Enterovibrio sp.]